MSLSNVDAIQSGADACIISVLFVHFMFVDVCVCVGVCAGLGLFLNVRVGCADAR